MMGNQPVFWVMGLPLLAAIGLWLLSRWPRALAAAGAGVAGLLAFWLWSLDLAAGEAVWLVYGRSFTLTPGLQSLFVYLYLTVGLLCLLSWPVPAGPRFVPLLVGLLAPAAAMLLVRPFLLAAPFWLLLVVMVLLLCADTEEADLPATQAALRYWLLMLVALALLLVAARMLEGEQAALLLPAARLLAIALAIILAGFPFFLWLRPLVTAVPLPVIPVLVVIVPLLLLVLTYHLLLAYPALSQTDAFRLWLPWSGGLTVLLAGFLTLRAVTWRSLLAGLVLLDMGFGLVALALVGQGGWEAAVILHGVRLVSLLLVGGGLALMDRGQYSVSGIQYSAGGEQSSAAGGKGSGPALLRAVLGQTTWQFWLLCYGLLSLLGLPLTPGFSGRWAVLVELGGAEVASLPLSLLLVGGMGLALWGIGRQIGPLFRAEVDRVGAAAASEPVGVRGAVLAGLLLALLLAAFPQLLLGPLVQLALRF